MPQSTESPPLDGPPHAPASGPPERSGEVVLARLKRIVVAVVGGTVLLIGVALVVLPGPAFIVIPAGLSILAIEFEWSRRWLRRAKSMVRKNGMDRRRKRREAETRKGR